MLGPEVLSEAERSAREEWRRTRCAPPYTPRDTVSATDRLAVIEALCETSEPLSHAEVQARVDDVLKVCWFGSSHTDHSPNQYVHSEEKLIHAKTGMPQKRVANSGRKRTEKGQRTEGQGPGQIKEIRARRT